jgi:hypothetical protein
MASVELAPTSTIAPRYLRMSRAYYRSASYALLGSCVLSGAGIWVNRLLQAPPDRNWVALLFPTTGLGLLLYVWRWRMRVDGRGVAVRALLGWREWTWDDMFAGKVRFRSLLRFEHVRPLGRTLSLEPLAPADAHYVSRLCRLACARPPASASLPLQIVFIDQWGRRVGCSNDGIQLPGRFAPVVPWTNVVRAKIVRSAREMDDFQQFELQLADRIVRATAIQQWSVRQQNDAATMVAFLIAKISSDRVSVISLGDPPQTIREAEHLLTENQAKLSKFQNILRWWPLTCVGLVLFCCLTRLWHMIPFTAFLGAKYQLIFWLMGGPFRRRQRLLESAHDELLAGGQPDHCNPAWTVIRA